MIRLSTKLRNNMLGPTGLAATFVNGVIDIYTGTQPLTADTAASGTKLGTVSLSSGAVTAEISASKTLTLAGTSGSVNTVLVGNMNIIPSGAVLFTTDLTTTAALLAAAVNAAGLYEATSASDVVTIIAPPGTGATHNGLTLTSTVTTMTATSGGNLAGGVTAVNGLTFTSPSSGMISKSGVWSCTGEHEGTAGWFRMKAGKADADGASTTLARLDGAIAIAGSDMNVANVVVSVGSPVTIDSLTITMPSQ